MEKHLGGGGNVRARIIAEGAVLALAALAFTLAWVADLRWCERHLLREYWAFDDHQRHIASAFRIVAVVVGAALVLVRPVVGRWVRRATPGDAGRLVVAALLACAASECGLRSTKSRSAKPPNVLEVAMGEPDARYGWRWLGTHSAVLEQSGRRIEYAFDADHDRASKVTDVADPTLPTILFTGESVSAGHGLHWEETFPALVGRELGLQVVNLSVHGYGADQAFLRVVDELPRFQRPVAVVTFFLEGASLARTESDDHPHIVFDGVEPKLVSPHGFFHDLRVAQLWRAAVPYRGDGPINLTAQIMKETDRRARERGAQAIFLAPNFGWGSPRSDAYLIDELFVRQNVTVITPDVGFHPLPGDDFHPEASVSRVMADAVVDALRSKLAKR